MRILAVDPGEKHIGIAISDPTGTIAQPLIVLTHVSRSADAATIANIARENQVEHILVGSSVDEDGYPTQQSKHAQRLAEAIHLQSNLPVQLWDESFSTQEARLARIAMATTRRKRRGHLDDLAATVLLQSYLEANLTN